MWTYIQRTGNLYHDGALAAKGYSGRGTGMNNPMLEAVADTGPIPCDLYTISRAFTHKTGGPFTLRLTPNDGIAGETSRAGFLIHGDNADHTASHGCIILPRIMRLAVDAAVQDGDNQLEVLAEERMTA